MGSIAGFIHDPAEFSPAPLCSTGLMGSPLALSAIYFTIVTATYGITFFLPQIVKGIGLSNVMTGLVTAMRAFVALAFQAAHQTSALCSTVGARL
jgi:hypothetical protein